MRLLLPRGIPLAVPPGSPLSITAVHRINDNLIAECFGTQAFVSCVYETKYRTSQNFRDQKFSRIASKKGGRNIYDKNIREGGSDTLMHNTLAWLQCLCGSLDL